MILFVNNSQRKGTCYYEFYKGKWDNKTFWRDDSIFLHDDLMYKAEGFELSLIEVVNFNAFGETEITLSQWRKIGEIVLDKDITSQEVYKEADIWAQKVFKEYECFTILGL
ncbi:MAG TPA: hypothetical protein VIL26_05370 [Clostridia bacterium]